MRNNIVQLNNRSSSLLEISRKDLNRKSDVQSPARVQRSKNYHINGRTAFMDGDSISKFIYKDVLILKAPVGKYICTVQFNGVLHNIVKIVSGIGGNGNVNVHTVRRALLKAIDDGDLHIHCTCPDWRYRFAYWATKYDYNAGMPETRPAKIRNPDDSLGSMCKHLICVLKNKRWLESVASNLMKIIQKNVELIREVYGLDEYEFFVQANGANLRYGNKPVRNYNYSNKPAEDDEEEIDQDALSQSVDDLNKRGIKGGLKKVGNAIKKGVRKGADAVSKRLDQLGKSVGRQVKHR